MRMKNLVSAIAALTLSVSAFAVIANAETTTSTPVMTYVDYDQADVAMGYTTPARTGYHKNSGLGFGNTGWGCNWTTYLKLDVTSITDTVTSATLTIESSGSTDSKRTAGIGLAEIAYNDWDDTLTYNTAVANGMNANTGLTVGQQWTTSKSASTFNTLTYDITDIIANDADGIITFALYETNAGGCYVQNPVLTVETTSAAVVDYTINYVCNGETVKTVADSAAVGLTVTADSIVYDDNGAKYVVADGATTSMEIVDGENVLNVDVTACAAISSVVVNYNLDGTAILTENKAVTGYEGDVVTVGFKKYIIVDGTVYEATKYSSSDYYIAPVTLAADASLNVTVTAKAIEGTPIAVIETSGDTANYANVRASEGEAARGATIDYGTVEAGTYSIEALSYARGNDTWVYLDGEALCKLALSTGGWGSATTTEIAVPYAGVLTVGPATGTDYVDCALLIKTSDTVSQTVTMGTEDAITDAYDEDTNEDVVIFAGIKLGLINDVTLTLASESEGKEFSTALNFGDLTLDGGSVEFDIVVYEAPADITMSIYAE